MFEISQQFSFEAAHTLKRNVPLPEYEPSVRIHGHTYFAEVSVRGDLTPGGMIGVTRPSRGKSQLAPLDLYDLRARIEEVRKTLDHRFLDEVEGLGPPTIENLCVFIGTRLSKNLPVSCIAVWRHGGDKCRWFVNGAEE